MAPNNPLLKKDFSTTPTPQQALYKHFSFHKWQIIKVFVVSAAQIVCLLHLLFERGMCALKQDFSVRWLENVIKSDPNLVHVGVHWTRQTQAHTNDIEINWYNDTSLCLAVVRSENLALWFQALHFEWHVMWSWTCQGKINLLFLLRFMYEQCLCVAMGYFKRQWKRVAGVTGSESTYVTEHR